MSAAWNDGYITESEYTYGYYQDINPVFQRFCLLVNGIVAPKDTPDACHCELGFGQGVSINIHAAAGSGQYIGTDFNPAHCAHANSLADAVGKGTRLYDDSFEQLLNREDLPQFDTISLHGIWSWVNDKNRGFITEFARRYLKSGGVLYISYNCLPGWAPMQPLQKLLASHTRFAASHHKAPVRIGEAMDFAHHLVAATPNYVKMVPAFQKKLEQIQKLDRQYLIHEYLNEEWSCPYFIDVVDALAPAKLDYACTASPLDTVDVVHLSPEAQAFLQEIPHPTFREQTRDYFINRQFRKDLYIRGVRRLAPAEQQLALLKTRFILLVQSDQVTMKVNGALGEGQLSEAVYVPVLEALAAEGATPKTLQQLLDATKISYGQVLQAVIALIAKGNVAPCQSEEAESRAIEACQKLNLHLCKRAQFGNEIEMLASPVTGGGIPVNRFQQLFILAIHQGRRTEEEWAEFACRILFSQGQKLVKNGAVQQGYEENLEGLQKFAHDFMQKRVPHLKMLKIM